MAEIYDNLGYLPQEEGRGVKLADALHRTMEYYDRLDIATGYMNLSAWDEFADEIGQAPFEPGTPVARILLGMVPRSITEQMHREAQAEMRGESVSSAPKNDERAGYRDELVQHLRGQLMAGGTSSSRRQALLTLKEHLESGRVQMKVYTKQALHGKTYVAHTPKERNPYPVVGFVGSSNFTRPGLHTNLELNVELTDSDHAAKLKNWFEKLWRERTSFDITREIIDLIDQSWVEPADPYDVYMKVCYELSEDARFGEQEYALSPRLEHMLMDYQKSAAHTLARRLMRRGGTMLGDVVGLGKTLTAIAVASMLQNEENMRVLVLCPKNLEQMWDKHLSEYDVVGKVVRYSMAAAELPDLARYQLVICDESHNLRNENTQVWRAIKEYVSRNESRVLLLTATPFNLSFSDVKAQLALYLDEDADLGIIPEAGLKEYPRKFDKLEGNLSTLRAFEISEEPEDWRTLMSDHLVRRTRAYTKRQAPTEMWTSPDGLVTKERSYLELSTGKFYYPDWVSQPVSHSFKADDPARFMEDDQTLDDLRDLRLPRYDISGYDNPNAHHSPEDRAIIEAARSGRGNVRGFVLSGLYKRLSSSGYSFIQSLTRQLIRNELWIYAIDHQLSVPTGSFSDDQLGLEGSDAADFESVDGLQVQDLGGNLEQMYESLVQSAPAQTRWVSSKVFTSRLRDDLQHDSELIKAMLRRFGTWQVETDSKLHALRDLIEQKHANDKVLVFTEYKDTAYYIAEGLQKLGVENVAAVAGDTDDPASYARRFSPVSNRVPTEQASDAEAPAQNGSDELRVLVATDVLSEGQNLQDAHVVVNYDLPWAIIRLIQRAGRVDRVGQVHHEVNVYLISHQTVERTLKLRSRIRERLESAAKAFGADQAFFTDMSSDDAAARTLEDFYSGNLDSSEPDEEGIDAVSEAAERWADFAKKYPEDAERIMKMQDKRLATRALRGESAVHPADDNALMVSYVRTNSEIDLFAVRSYDPATDSTKESMVPPAKALGLFYAEYSTPSQETDPKDYDLQQKLTQYVLRQEGTTHGNLRGVRRQVFRRFYGADNTASVDTLELQDRERKVLDKLYHYPLRRQAESELRRMLRRKADNRSLLDALLRMQQDDELLVKESDMQMARVVCSLAISDPDFEGENPVR